MSMNDWTWNMNRSHTISMWKKVLIWTSKTIDCREMARKSTEMKYSTVFFFTLESLTSLDKKFERMCASANLTKFNFRHWQNEIDLIQRIQVSFRLYFLSFSRKHLVVRRFHVISGFSSSWIDLWESLNCTFNKEKENKRLSIKKNTIEIKK